MPTALDPGCTAGRLHCELERILLWRKRREAVCSMEIKKDDSPLKARFLAVRKEIYNRYTEKQQTEQQTVSAALKRGMSECERESEFIEIDTDITAPGAIKQTKRTVMDRFKVIKKPSHVDLAAEWSEEVLGKGLTFDFFSDPLVQKAMLMPAQCADSIITFSSTHGKDPSRTFGTAQVLDTQQAQEQIGAATCGKSYSCPW